MRYDRFVVEVPADFTMRFSAILKPMEMRGFPPGAPSKYSCCFPAEALPPGAEEWLGTVREGVFMPLVRERQGVRFAAARSNRAPVVFPGMEGSYREALVLQTLYSLCDAHNLPRETAFQGRALRLMVQPVEYRAPHWFKAHGIGLSLIAVQVELPPEMDEERWRIDPLKLLVDTRAAELRAFEGED